MVNSKHKKKRRLNNSKPSFNTKLSQALHKVMKQQGGTVTYFFEEERYDTKKDEVVINSYVIKANINKEVFTVLDPITKKSRRATAHDLFSLFRDTQHDLGAKRFELD